MFTQHFTLVTAMVSTMVKIVNVWRRRPDLETAVDLLNWERRQACSQKFGNLFIHLYVNPVEIFLFKLDPPFTKLLHGELKSSSFVFFNNFQSFS